MTREVRNPPLAGIKVLDFGTALLGPFASSQLGMLGADVIRVEPPNGDLVMHIGTRVGGMGSWYVSSNLNKRAVVLDLRKEDDHQVALDLLRWADVVIENRRVGTMDSLGLGWDSAIDANPGIVFASCSGYGSTGPWRDLASGDPLMQAMSGFASLTGEPEAPELLRYTQTDLAGAVALCQAVLLGLLRRDLSGHGVRVETSLFEAVATLQAIEIGDFIASGEPPKRSGNASRRISPSGSFETLDGRYINVSAPDDDAWDRLCVALEIGSARDDERFATNDARLRNRSELEQLLAPRFREKPEHWWLVYLRREKIPCGPVSRRREVLDDPHVRLQRLVADVETPWGPIKVAAPPWQFDGSSVLPPSPMAIPDAERAAILRDIRVVERRRVTCDATPVAPLAGTLVVDFSENIRGSFVTKQLADAGARVIVIEREAGSPLRALGAVHESLAAGKESIAVDFDSRSDQALVDALTSDADVVIDDSDPGSDKRRGQDAYRRVRSRGMGERIVYCSLTTFGDEGPYSSRAGTELELQGLAGYMQFLGSCGGRPHRVGLDLASVGTAMFAVVGILAALFERRRSGRGQQLRVSELAALLAYGTYWLGPLESADAYDGLMMTAPEDPPVTGYRTADRPIMLSVLSGSIERGKEAWQKLAVDFGLERLIDDPFWADIGPRLIGWGREAEKTRPVLEKAFSERSSDDLLWTIAGAGAVAGVVNSYEELFSGKHPQVEALGILRRDSDGNLVPSISSPWWFGGQRPVTTEKVPSIGEHTTFVRVEYGDR